MEHTIRIPSIEEFKAHVKKHTTEYAVGTAVVVTAGVTFLVTRQFSGQTISIAPVFNNIPIVNNTSNVFLGGPLHKIVQNDVTGEVLGSGSVTETAKAIGVTLDTLSRHLNKYPGYEDIKGLTYSIIGVGN